MEQLTKKDRKAILSFLTELPQEAADKIAAINGVSTMTVYRYWKKIKDKNAQVEINNITLAIYELARANKQKKLSGNIHRRLSKVREQLSAA